MPGPQEGLQPTIPWLSWWSLMRPLIIRPCQLILYLLWEPTVLCSISLISSLPRVCIWPSKLHLIGVRDVISCCRRRSTVSAFLDGWLVSAGPLRNQQWRQEDYRHFQPKVSLLRISGLHVQDKTFLSGSRQHWRSFIGVFPRAYLRNLDQICHRAIYDFFQLHIIFLLNCIIFFIKLLMLG